MGPRSNDRGNKAFSCGLKGTCLLQWGRDLTIAEIRLWNSDSSLLRKASMGPRSNDRGNTDQRCFSCRPRQASMGPRSNDRGNYIRAGRRSNLYCASMGPRSNDRGNNELRTGGLEVVGLQWGRDLTIAEISWSSTLCRYSGQLQWGRDLTIAEMEMGLADEIVEVGLQWGRDLTIAEIIPNTTAVSSCTLLQWGRDLTIAEIRPFRKGRGDL